MQVLLFGISKDIVGENKLIIDTSENIHSVGELKHWMKQKYPKMQKLRSFAVAVDCKYAEDEQSLTERNEVAIIPPVSGG